MCHHTRRRRYCVFCEVLEAVPRAAARAASRVGTWSRRAAAGSGVARPLRLKRRGGTRSVYGSRTPGGLAAKGAKSDSHRFHWISPLLRVPGARLIHTEHNHTYGDLELSSRARRSDVGSVTRTTTPPQNMPRFPHCKGRFCRAPLVCDGSSRSDLSRR